MKSYKSDVLASVHETIGDLAEAGLISKRTMREFDELCLAPVEPLSAEEIRTIRLESRVSQTVFARFLNVSPRIISQWERGEKSPSGASLKLLTIVQRKGLDAIA